MCSLTGHAQTLMKTVTQQPFQNKQALERGLHNCSVECKAVAHTPCTVGDLLSPVMQPRSVFSYLRRSQAAVSNFAPRKKNVCGGENFWSEYPSVQTPQSNSLSGLSFHRAQVALLHLLHSETRHGGGTATPKKAPLSAVSLYKNRPDKHNQF